MNFRLSVLELMQVVRDDGKELGRLMDIRSRAKLGRIDRTDVLDADALLIGASGWLEQIGLRDAGARAVPAKSIVAVESERIIVRVVGEMRGQRPRKKRR